MKIFAIIPAAGIGQRAKTAAHDGPKQYWPLHGITMLEHAAAALEREPRIEKIFVAAAPSDAEADRLFRHSPIEVLHTGGASRFETVLNTLLHLQQTHQPHASQWVLVHDAARPALPLERLRALIDCCLLHKHCGLLAMPVADTLKRSTQSDCGSMPPVTQSAQTVDRSEYWTAQTPQMFPVLQLLECLKRAAEQADLVTDEASAAEMAGIQPLLVRGDRRNFKVTWPEDFELVSCFLELIHDRRSF